MRIAFAIAARHAEPLADGTLVALGLGSDVLHAPGFPVSASVTLVVCMKASHVEPEEHTLALGVLGPSFDPVMEPMEAPVVITPGVMTPDGWEVGRVISVVVAFDAAEPGIYSIELTPDGGTPTSVPIIINAAD